MTLQDQIATDQAWLVRNMPSSKVAQLFSDGSNYDDDIWGIFSNEYIELLEVSGMRPTYTVQTTDVNNYGMTRDSLVKIMVDSSLVTYRVAVFEPNTTGLTKLILEEQ